MTNALVHRQWLAVYAGRVIPSSGGVLELELHARQLAQQLGVARRVINIAIERHGPMPVIGAILHVGALPASAWIRSHGRLLASLLRREQGQLTPDRFARKAPPAEALGESEAVAIARRCAPSRQGQVDFAQFKTAFTDEPGVERVLWLFTMVLGHSRWLWGRFCATQDLQTVLRCHIDAFAAMGGAPFELLYDRMKTAVVGESAVGIVTYNPSLVGLLSHYGAVPRACRPYRAQTKGKVERPYRYVREDFFFARSFRDLDDLNAQFEAWRTSVANARVHATTRRIVAEHFAEERSALIAHPAGPYSAVLTVERRVSREGMVKGSAATSTACPTPPANGCSTSRAIPRRSASSRMAR